VPLVCPSSGELNGTRRDETGRSGGTIRCEIKALAGNSATCLGFCFRLDAGSIPAASIPRSPAVARGFRVYSPSGISWNLRSPSLRRANFTRHILYGSHQLQWIHGARGSVSTLANVAWEVDEPEMGLALLRLSGPRLQVAMSGTTLLAAWVDFLNLAEAVLRQCPAYSVERLFRDMNRVQQRIEPSMRALSSLEPAQVEAATVATPELMSQLTQEFHSIREGARVATERAGQMIAAAQAIEMLTMLSMMKLSLPRLPPAAPVTLGASLVMGSNGVMMGSQVVVTAEWVEMMRRLVQAGVLSVPAVSAAVRIHAGR
jgi:hypothetical protein